VRAVVLAAPENLRVEEVPEPAIEDPRDAIVRVTGAAICGADLFPYHGHTPGFEDGTILGHEFVGVVAEVGPGVERMQPGQRVVNASMTSDGSCAHCRAGRRTQCQSRALFGYSGVYPRLEGGQADLVRIPFADRCLWPIPDAVSDDDAVFLADMLPTGHGAVSRGGVALGDVVVVLGLGCVGLMATMVAAGTARKVIAVDGIAERRELAAAYGAEAVDPAGAADTVAAGTDGLGADVVIEAAGVPAALDASLQLVRGRGTVSVVGAHFEPDYPLNNALMFEREITLRFTVGDPGADREMLLGAIAAGKLAPSRVLTHRVPLDEAPEAYRMFDAREAVKLLLEP
jgi:2-desacetyl-2-hydroxyethyl bacteriochlorophyllide A dehydrogenase